MVGPQPGRWAAMSSQPRRQPGRPASKTWHHSKCPVCSQIKWNSIKVATVSALYASLVALCTARTQSQHGGVRWQRDKLHASKSMLINRYIKYIYIYRNKIRIRVKHKKTALWKQMTKMRLHHAHIYRKWEYKQKGSNNKTIKKPTNVQHFPTRCLVQPAQSEAESTKKELGVKKTSSTLKTDAHVCLQSEDVNDDTRISTKKRVCVTVCVHMCACMWACLCVRVCVHTLVCLFIEGL